jgi:hypothetical protein
MTSLNRVENSLRILYVQDYFSPASFRSTVYSSVSLTFLKRFLSDLKMEIYSEILSIKTSQTSHMTKCHGPNIYKDTKP